MTFDQLDTAAAAISYSDPVRDGVNYVIAHAADNAACSDADAISSVGDILAYTADAAVCDWFAARGVRW